MLKVAIGAFAMNPHPADNIRVVRITALDVERMSDNMKMFHGLIQAHEEMYPGIDIWLKKKVLPGMKDGERVAYIGIENDRPAVSCVLKRGELSKFCHLHIADGFQSLNLGEVFFSIMALEIRSEAKQVYFTLPESLWNSKREFFLSFGFEQAEKANVQYRLFEDELQCTAPFSVVWQHVLDKMPKLISSFSHAILLSIQPRHVSRIMRGEKTVEVRTRFSSKWRGSRAAMYSTSPTRAIVGHARIADVVQGDPEGIWKAYSEAVGCSREEFMRYANGAKHVYAIILDDIQPYRDGLGIPLTQMQHLLSKDLVPPQSYYNLSNNKEWAEAMTVAELLYRRLVSLRSAEIPALTP